MAGKWIAPFSLCSVFSLCFSEQVGAMVIGAIEIDGAHHPVQGCELFPWKCTSARRAGVLLCSGCCTPQDPPKSLTPQPAEEAPL